MYELTLCNLTNGYCIVSLKEIFPEVLDRDIATGESKGITSKCSLKLTMTRHAQDIAIL